MTNIDKLIALAEEHDRKATKGPWGHDGNFVWEGDETKARFCVASVGPSPHKDEIKDANLCLIAASRTAWPATAKALAAERDRANVLEAQLKVAVEALEYAVGPTRDVKTPRLREAIAEINRIASGQQIEIKTAHGPLVIREEDE